MKNYLTSLLWLVLALPALAQSPSVERQVLANAGGDVQTMAFGISWTLGEAVTETIFAENLILTQGFQQPDDFTTGPVGEISLESLGIAVFPNPSSLEVTIRTNRPDRLPLRLQVFDLYGRTVTSRRLTEEHETLDVHTWADGVYLLRFYTPDNQTSSPVKLQKITNR